MRPRFKASIGGIDFNDRDDDGVLWGMHTLDGWEGSPGSSTVRTKRPRSHGTWSGDGTFNGRPLAPSGVVLAPSADLSVAAENKLNAAFTLAETQLTVIEGSSTRWCMVSRDDSVICSRKSAVAFEWSAQVWADDPRKFGEAIVRSTSLPTSSGGLRWPVRWPIKWTGKTETGVLTITNPGTVVAPVVLRIGGPVTAPKVTHVQSGREIIFASSYSVGTNNWLTVDMERHTVLENDQSSRNGYVTQRGWFGLDPGVNQIIFTAAAASESALLTVTTYPAWM